MRLFTSDEAMGELSKRKRKRSLSVNDALSEDLGSEDDQMASYASSVTLCPQSALSEAELSNEKRLIAIESILASQQDLLRKILSASEAPSPPASAASQDRSELPPVDMPQDGHETCSNRTPEDIYERARIEAGFRNRHEWNAAYIHGMVLIDDKRSMSLPKTDPCGPCVQAHKFAVCVGLSHDDPYKEFLIDERKVCCGWCEYNMVVNEENQQPREKSLKPDPLANSVDEQNIEIAHANPLDMEWQERRNQQIRQSEFFINGEGLEHEVVAAEIPQFLGIDSVVRPGTHFNAMTSETIKGFYITAHRPPTSAMLMDLREDSAAWQAEKERKKMKNPAAKLKDPYPGKQPPRYHTYPFEFSCASK